MSQAVTTTSKRTLSTLILACGIRTLLAGSTRVSALLAATRPLVTPRAHCGSRPCPRARIVTSIRHNITIERCYRKSIYNWDRVYIDKGRGGISALRVGNNGNTARCCTEAALSKTRTGKTRRSLAPWKEGLTSSGIFPTARTTQRWLFILGATGHCFTIPVLGGSFDTASLRKIPRLRSCQDNARCRDSAINTVCSVLCSTLKVADFS